MPQVLLLAYSLSANGPGEGAFTPTLDNFRRALEPAYLRILARSAGLALATTAITLAAAYPAALALRAVRPGARAALVTLLVVPSWLNLLVRNYAWIVILRREGVLNTLLLALGVAAEPLPLLFNQGAVLVGLVHGFLPFMLLPVYAAVERLDWRLVEAARDLGAGRWRTFYHVVLPGTAAGAAAGCVLVFIPALGAFITPDLLGGAESLMVGTVIESQVLQVRDWPFAAALAVWLVALLALPALLFARLRAPTRA